MSKRRKPQYKPVAHFPGRKETNMTENDVEEGFDPSAHTADEVKAELEEADDQEKLRIAAAEQADKNRKSVLAAAGVDENVRLDASGRQLNGWEVLPKAKR